MLSATPYKIPLEVVDIKQKSTGQAAKKDAKPEYKLGIYVGLGGNANPRLYEFDTGGEGFWAAADSKSPKDLRWWGAKKVVSRGSLGITYSSGNRYVANKVRTSVELYQPDADGGFSKVVGTGQPVDMGQIVRYSDAKSKSAVVNWNNALKTGSPPLQNWFYGDFGASLSPNGTSEKNSILSIVPQIPIPAGLTIGFIVHVGDLEEGGNQPYLQIGLTPEDLKSFDTTLPMNPYTGTAQRFFPITGVDTYSERIANADFSWTDPKTNRTQSFKDLGWTIDTGASSVTVWQGDSVAVNRGFLNKPTRSGGLFTGRFKKHVDLNVTATAANPHETNINMTIDGGSKKSADDKIAANYHATTAMGQNYVNTGLYTFTQYDVMYNLEDGTIHFRSSQTPTQN
ncbi:MAG: hypothetical protein P4L85_18355 [Paludisphaera borealis]|uniref:hypothetical protein n=1 Tax=Paludisphaera borealis TaxID=1387353 RepID=UPI002845E2E8|nr:hypothetical protein [Paludisphaera borealis]MDR3621319.1 hypothetical protein [Paludisphaera borealis]